MKKPDSVRVTIVLLGDFNPKIFQPAWFALHNLIPKPEAEDAEISLLNHDVCAFKTSWLKIDVLRERFQASPLEDGRDEELRDLVLGTFGALDQTPLHTIGINTIANWSFPDEATWHEVGHRLVPKEGIWDSILEKPGMAILRVAGVRSDDYKGLVNVTVVPIREEKIFRVRVEVNDHIVVRPKDDVRGAEAVVTVLRTVWDDSRKRAKNIIERLLRLPQ